MPSTPSSSVAPLTRSALAGLIDHTMLRPQATQADIETLCEEAAEYGFAAVSIHPVWTPLCATRLEGTDVKVDVAIGFPLGATTTRVKLEEAWQAIDEGATELDMVINLGALKTPLPGYVEGEIAALVGIAASVPVKVILETAYLADEEKVSVCRMSERAGAAFVKTATGFGPGGATVGDVALMRQTVGDRLGVKAAGGIRTCADALAMIQAGANRIGTSAGVAILLEFPERR